MVTLDDSSQQFFINMIELASRMLRMQFSWPSWQQSGILEQNDFSNSEAPHCPNACHQVSAQSNFAFKSRCGLKIFKLADMVEIMDIRTEQL